jgi:hypothetical protein
MRALSRGETPAFYAANKTTEEAGNSHESPQRKINAYLGQPPVSGDSVHAEDGSQTQSAMGRRPASLPPAPKRACRYMPATSEREPARAGARLFPRYPPRGGHPLHISQIANDALLGHHPRLTVVSEWSGTVR